MTNSTRAGSTRVKAFRDRLADGDYRRVEGYITGSEKAQVDAIKRALGTTSDTVVAGLLRLGLQSYEHLASSQGSAEVNGSLVAGPSTAQSVLSAGCAPAALNQASALHQASPTGAASSTNPIERFFQKRKDASK